MNIIDKLKQQKDIYVIGGAVCDIVLNIPELPKRGDDIEATHNEYQVGGCAFNVARGLKRLGFNIKCGITIGNGPNGEMISKEMKKEGINCNLFNSSKDNGMCLALVDFTGERTFITVTGCEGNWTSDLLDKLKVSDNSIIYASGYELAADDNYTLKNWLINLPESVIKFIDLGPRVNDVDKAFLKKIYTGNCILSINEAEGRKLCGNGVTPEIMTKYAVKNKIDIVFRLGEKGAYVCSRNGEKNYIKPLKINVIDTVGAGDSHAAGFLAGISSDFSLLEAAALGNLTAAYTVSGGGANYVPTKKELKKIESYLKTRNSNN